jgi:hypothetical protein
MSEPFSFSAAGKTLLVSHLEATPTSTLVSVDSKRLTENLTPLDATLTKNRGGGASHENPYPLYPEPGPEPGMEREPQFLQSTRKPHRLRFRGTPTRAQRRGLLLWRRNDSHL